jgi:hypothetical protein
VEQFFLFGQIGKRKFIRIVESRIPRIAILSIEKRDCENYLFEDCYLKACMVEQKSKNKISGRSPREKGVLITPTYPQSRYASGDRGFPVETLGWGNI